jgi:hypothetical protein
MDGEAFSSPMVVPGTALVPRESSTVIVEDSLDDDSNKQDFVERDSIARERTQACVQDNNKLKLEIPPQTLRIGIVGGGLGGLACALALQQAGFYNVTVFEADERFSDRREGFGLTLTNNKKGPLAKLGLLRDCIQHDCASNEHWVFNPTGKVLGYYGRGLLSSSPNSNVAVDDSDMIMTTERGNLRIPRQALRRMLLSRLKTNTVQWGKRLISYDERANVPIKATFRGYSSENLETQEASVDVDVLIGADGLRSVVRTIRDACNPDLSPAPLRYIGVSVIIGLSTACHKLLDSCGFYILDGVEQQHRSRQYRGRDRDRGILRAGGYRRRVFAAVHPWIRCRYVVGVQISTRRHRKQRQHQIHSAILLSAGCRVHVQDIQRAFAYQTKGMCRCCCGMHVGGEGFSGRSADRVVKGYSGTECVSFLKFSAVVLPLMHFTCAGAVGDIAA